MVYYFHIPGIAEDPLALCARQLYLIFLTYFKKDSSTSHLLFHNTCRKMSQYYLASS